MLEDLKNSYQFYLLLFSLFVLGMGICRLLGKNIGRTRGTKQRTGAHLPVASLFPATGGADDGLSYDSLFKGGLLGVYIIFFLHIYVVIMAMLTTDLTNFEDAASELAIYMGYPISMLLFFILFAVVAAARQNQAIKYDVGAVAILSLLLVAGGLTTIYMRHPGATEIILLEGLVAAILVMLFSCLTGMIEGVRSVDPDANYPLVTMRMLDSSGDEMSPAEKVWLYARTESDYRILRGNGENRIVPVASVRSIHQVRGALDQPPA